MNKTLFVIDGHALAYRAFFSMPTTLTLENGQPVNAAYGFIALLFKGLETFSPDYVCVCFDRKEPCFRKKLYPEYKAHRPPAPDDFISQLPLLNDLLNKLQIPVFDLAGWEADDLMGTIARIAEETDFNTMLMTGDRDALQLVTAKTNVVINKKGITDFEVFTPDKVQEKYNLAPRQIVDLKALQGDSSDNIPGVAGIGEKTATSLLTQFPDLDKIYTNLEKIKSKSVRNKLEADKEKAYLSYKLATIDRFAPLNFDLEATLYKPDWPIIIKTFQEYRFTSLVKKYQPKTQQDQLLPFTTNSLEKNPDHTKKIKTYQLIDSLEKLEHLLPQLQKGFAIDLETTSLNVIDAQIVGISIAIKPYEAWYIACNDFVNQDSIVGTLFSFTAEKPKENPFLKKLKSTLENPDIPKYTHNGKYEYLVFLNYNITLQGMSFDTLLAAYLLYPGERLGLKALTERFLAETPITYEDVAGKGKTQISFQNVPLDQATEYACADADHTLRLKQLFEPQLKEKDLWELYQKIEHPLQIVLAKIEREGVTIDSNYLQQLLLEFESEINQLQKQIFEVADSQFNINSPKQLSEVLYTKLKLPVIKKNKTGISTDSSVLEKLLDKHEVIKLLLRYRTIDKLRNTYVKALPELINPKTGHIHTSFNQTVTTTGRLSSTNPNLQNIPIRTPDGQKIRKAFIPSSKENLILSADYSQIELRLMAVLAQDENMIRAFNNKEDIHTSTASVVFNIAPEEVTKELRYKAKAVNFGIIYGQSAFGLSQQLNIPRGEAKEIIDNYFQKFPKVKKFMEDTIKFCEKHGYVRTEFNRLREIPDIHATNKSARGFAERIAINTRLQGTAADIIKIAMINLQKRLEKENFKAKIIIQVHDELVLDVPKAESEKVMSIVVSEMQNAASYPVALEVDAVLGNNWQEVG